MLPVGNIFRHYRNSHCYEDDTQLYLFFKPNKTNRLAKYQNCLKDNKGLMTSNFLLLNSNKI